MVGVGIRQRCSNGFSKPKHTTQVTMTISAATSVCIIGSGPAGLLLSQLLASAGIYNIVIDRKDRAYMI